MTLEEYYKILEEKWKQVDKSSFESVREYNEYRRQLRKEVEDEDNK